MRGFEAIFTRGHRKSVLVLLGLALAARTSTAESAAEGEAETGARRILRVGYAGSEPFVLGTNHADGLSVGVWRVVADRAGVSYDLIRQDNVQATIDRVAGGDLDVGVGPLSITAERAEQVRFTQPYFHAELGIASRKESPSIWSRLAPFAGRIFAGASLAFALSLIAVGSVIWVLERKRNPEHFPGNPARGIANGIWFALVTMTTVGYGDRVPVTLGGRMVAGVWMVVALVTTTSLTAGIASAITVIQLDRTAIEKAEDLLDRRVAVIAGTTGEAFVETHGAVPVKVADMAAAMRAVKHRDAVAIVHDKPILHYHVSRNPSSGLTVAEIGYEPQGYGFALTPELGAAKRLNIALLEAQEAGQIDRAVNSWLGSLPGDATDSR